jgi:enoyl-CoA hydratase/carnithine racemase
VVSLEGGIGYQVFPVEYKVAVSCEKSSQKEKNVTEYIITELVDGVLEITLNRADKKNALNYDMYDTMADAIEAAAEDTAVRVLLITGSGDSFSAGNDMGNFVSDDSSERNDSATRFLFALEATPVPVVAAVNGLAVGVGTTMLLHCDQVYAAESAWFTMPFVNLGVVPEAGSSMLLPRQVGYQKAAELLMLGEPFDAMTAQQAGIVCRVCTDDSLLASARETACKLAAKPRAALRATKQLLKRDSESYKERMEAEMQEFVVQIQSPASREIMTAFVEKRKPDPAKID